MISWGPLTPTLVATTTLVLMILAGRFKGRLEWTPRLDRVRIRRRAPHRRRTRRGRV
jgi:hypothetical protein